MSYAPGGSFHEIVVTPPDWLTWTELLISGTTVLFVPWHTPPEHRSVCVQGFASSHTVPLGRVGCAQVPVPLHWSAVQVLASAVQLVPDGSLFVWQLPDPSHVSGLSQSVFEGLPHVVPEGSGFCWQFPDPSHVSGLSHCVSELEPHAVPEDTG